jgi:hypothetical protein
MRTRRTDRRGFALAVAIFAIVIIGALIAGVFFAATQQYRIGRNEVLLARAQSAAEYGQQWVSTPNAGWNANWNNLAAGGIDSTTITAPLPAGTSAKVKVTRLGSPGSAALYLVASEGRAGTNADARARRRASSIVQLAPVAMNLNAALTTRGSAKIGGSSYIDGNDTPYAGWSCPSPGPNKPGIRIDNTNNIQTSGCKNFNCVAGSPQLQADPAAADTSTYFNYGGIDWAGLTAMAKVITTGPTGPSYNPDGSCNKGAVGNWGDTQRKNPAGACEGYFPILYAPGDLHLSSNTSGQGILLVNGNLKVTGGFSFYGPVIVRGDLDTQGTGGHFNGGVMAANVNLAQSTVLGNAVITFSSCILAQVLTANGVVTPLAVRPWAELY